MRSQTPCDSMTSTSRYCSLREWGKGRGREGNHTSTLDPDVSPTRCHHLCVARPSSKKRVCDMCIQQGGHSYLHLGQWGFNWGGWSPGYHSPATSKPGFVSSARRFEDTGPSQCRARSPQPGSHLVLHSGINCEHSVASQHMPKAPCPS